MTSPAPVGTSPRHAGRALDGRLGTVLAAAPERIVLIVVALALAAGVMVSVGLHEWWTVLPLAAILAALAWRPLAPGAPRPRDAIAAVVALAGTAVWTVVNIAMAAEYMLVVRDPGFLTLSGLWLVDHPSTNIPAQGAVEAAAVSTSVLPDASQAWNLAGDVIQPQGAKMLPATIAIGGWVDGDTGVLAANVVIGAAGILATFALARRFLSPLAALAPAGALALTVSHIGLSRPAYTEPLALLLAVAGILWAWRGLEKRSVPMLLAGAVVTGATSFVRIDGGSGALGTLAGVAVALALVEAPRRWRRRALQSFALVEAVVLLAGYGALRVWSTAYFDRLGSEAYALIAVYSLATLVVLAWSASWTDGIRGDAWLPTLSRRLGRRGATAVGGLVVAVLAGLASRPLWATAHRGEESSTETFVNGVVESFQSAQGLDVDGTRTYAESTMTWLSYYLTWPLVVLAIIGVGWATARMVRRDARWAVLLGSILAPTLLYLWRPSIVPDQIWAIRRFEPITLPGFLLLAAAAAWWLAGRARRESARGPLRRVAGVAFIVLPLTTWVSVQPSAEFPLSSAVNVTTREMIGARDMMAELCALDPGRPIVLVGSSEMFGGLRTVCDVPVVLALAAPDEDELVEMADAWGEQPLVLTRQADDLAWATDPSPVLTTEVRYSSYTLQRLPSTVIARGYTWYAGRVDAGGTIEPLSAVPTASAP